MIVGSLAPLRRYTGRFATLSTAGFDAEGIDGSPPEPNPPEKPAAESSAESGAWESDGSPRKFERELGPEGGAAPPSPVVAPSSVGTFTESGALPAGSEIDRDR